MDLGENLGHGFLSKTAEGEKKVKIAKLKKLEWVSCRQSNWTSFLKMKLKINSLLTLV